MKVAALLALLAALPAHAGDPVTPAQARANVVQALPQDIAKGLRPGGDLQTALQRLTKEQKAAAIQSLKEKEGELGRDPATLNVIGQAYAGLGKVQEAKQAAQAVLRQNPNDPGARQLLGWVTSQEKLAERGSGGGAGGDTGGFAPAATGGRPATLDGLEQKIQGFFRRGQNSNEFKSTMQDARGLSVAELKAAGIEFKPAAANQQDAVLISKTKNGGFTISMRDDALESGGDTEARAAAHLANGVRQAQTLRDHEYIGWALIKARGWISGGRTHRELAPGDADLDRNPTGASDRNLMAARKLVDRENYKFDMATEKYGEGMTSVAMGQINAKSKDSSISLEEIFAYFLRSTGRGNGG